MADITIQIRDNGPLIVRGGAVMRDAAGNQFEVQDDIALCRCGHSATKPFCDKAHRSAGFESAPRVDG